GLSGITLSAFLTSTEAVNIKTITILKDVVENTDDICAIGSGMVESEDGAFITDFVESVKTGFHGENGCIGTAKSTEPATNIVSGTIVRLTYAAFDPFPEEVADN